MTQHDKRGSLEGRVDVDKWLKEVGDGQLMVTVSPKPYRCTQCNVRSYRQTNHCHECYPRCQKCRQPSTHVFDYAQALVDKANGGRPLKGNTIWKDK